MSRRVGTPADTELREQLVEFEKDRLYSLLRGLCPEKYAPFSREAFEVEAQREADALLPLIAEHERAQVEAARREGWDEGYESGVADEATSQDWTGGTAPPNRVNPYRDRAARGETRQS